METQTNTNNWLEEETKNLKGSSSGDYEKLESVKLESGKIVKLTIDFSKPFNKWTETKDGKTVIKAIIPVTHKDIKKNLWLNTKNPLYGILCEAGKKGQTEFKISTTGSQKDTKYTLVEED